MKTREELLKTIKTSKTAKVVSLLVVFMGLFGYIFFDERQDRAERELLILDQGKFDQMVLK